jgi:hypothetical protein
VSAQTRAAGMAAAAAARKCLRLRIMRAPGVLYSGEQKYAAAVTARSPLICDFRPAGGKQCGGAVGTERRFRENCREAWARRQKPRFLPAAQQS